MAMTAIQTTSARLSFEDFLERSDEDCLAEWVDGKVQYRMPASLAHQLLCKFLLLIIELFVQERNIGTVLAAPFLMKLAARPAGREPDLLYLAEANRDRLSSTYLDGPADLVVEIVSPESRERDRGEKFEEYAASGITEYWIIDPELRIAEFFVLRETVYRPARIDSNGRFWSVALPGFWIQLSWLWDQPGITEVLGNWQSVAASPDE